VSFGRLHPLNEERDKMQTDQTVLTETAAVRRIVATLRLLATEIEALVPVERPPADVMNTKDRYPDAVLMDDGCPNVD
jgi:hypothetical protein